MPLIGLRAYSRHRRCTLSQVQKSIANGRLELSVHRKGRRLQIDVAEADREWEANRDVTKVRDRTAPLPRRWIRELPDAENDPALPLARAYDELLDLVTVIEERLSDAFRATVARDPKAPAGTWQAVYKSWGQIPDKLEALQRECRAAVPAIRAAS